MNIEYTLTVVYIIYESEEVPERGRGGEVIYRAK
jgi:hypothetical protein